MKITDFIPHSLSAATLCLSLSLVLSSFSYEAPAAGGDMVSPPVYGGNVPQEARNGGISPIHTYQLLDKLAENHGKVILVNFFAAFCGPCKKEIPELMQIRKEISQDDLLIIGIAIDRTLEEANGIVKKLGMDKEYPVFYGGEELANAYRINAIPFNVIYNKEGHIEVSEAGYVPGKEMKRFLMELIRR